MSVAKSVLDCYDSLDGRFKNLRDQLARASQSVLLNIAEGNGRWTARDRASYFRNARGSALECAAAIDLLAVSGGLPSADCDAIRVNLKRVVNMLIKLVLAQESGAREDAEEYGGGADEADFDQDHDRK